MDKPKLSPDFRGWGLGEEFEAALENLNDAVRNATLDCLAEFVSDFLSDDAVAFLRPDGLVIEHTKESRVTIPWGPALAIPTRMETLVPLFRFIRSELDDGEITDSERMTLRAILD